MANKENEVEAKLDGIIEEPEHKLNIPEELPVLMLRDIVVFPYMVVPLFVGREKSKHAIDAALSSHRMILLLTQKDMEIEEPKQEDVYTVGTVALVMRMLKLPDGRVRILAQGLTRARLEDLDEEKPYYSAKVSVLNDPEEEEESIEVEAMLRNVRDGLDRASSLGKNIPPEVMIIAANVEEAGRLADLTAAERSAMTGSSLAANPLGLFHGRLFRGHDASAAICESTIS
ncbi:MAG: LON peptidase substrate-binding domain-containing protein, partial [Candidatus Aminicenantaceae bacterium]